MKTTPVYPKASHWKTPAVCVRGGSVSVAVAPRRPGHREAGMRVWGDARPLAGLLLHRLYI
ncbi:hypothetical protein E2C01_086250 [Portunus trituberculatus]|uniref:Uncharacterized protein n=1 Tax=Portunus trituberculatus TaxID=210409 RepID=A0A5B7JB12_PORTR|nr:hypothetical protein [Portunus trituberculatus]